MDQDLVSKIKYASERNGIPQIVGLKGKYLYKFYEDVIVENVYARKTGVFERTGYYKSASFLLKSILYFFVVLISIIRIRKYQRRVLTKETTLNDVVYIAAAYNIVKSKEIKEIIPNCSIYYYPLAEMAYLEKHIKTFNEKGQPLFVDSFKLKHLIEVIEVFFVNYRKLSRFSKEIDLIFETNFNDVIIILLKTIYANKHYTRFVHQINNRKCIWLFEYHSNMEMLAFQSSIKEFRPKDVTIHMQHGTMLETLDMTYHHPVTDYDIVCGEREVRVLSDLNKYNSKLIGIGCPLQSLGYIKESPVELIRYDVLVLLTATNLSSTLDYQVKVLHKLSDMKNIKVLLRYRPASKMEDQRKLDPYTAGMTTSEGSSLDDDISKANVVVSFSADAMYSCFRQGRRMILIVIDKSIEEEFNRCNINSSNLKIMTVDAFTPSILNQMIVSREMVDYTKDSYVKYNFGCIDTVTYRNEFKAFLNSISC